MKYYSRLIYGEKFKRYKITFFIFFFIFAASIPQGALFSHKIFIFSQKYYLLADACLSESCSFDILADMFLHNFYFDLLLMCIMFFAGITIYSPIIGAVAVLLKGIFCGYAVAVCVSLREEGSLFLFIIKTLTDAVGGMILIIFAAVTCRVALRIFTEKVQDKKALFGGTLFNPGEFRGMFNFRFLLSYTLFFLFFTFLIAVVTALSTAVLALI